MNEVPNGYVLLQRHNDKPKYAACLDGGRFHGWLMWKHPDGQWVSERKLEAWEVMQAEDQRDDNIVHETRDETVEANSVRVKPEPVAKYVGVDCSRYTIEWVNGPLPEGTEFYAAPVEREVLATAETGREGKMTDERIDIVWVATNNGWGMAQPELVRKFARAIEREVLATGKGDAESESETDQLVGAMYALRAIANGIDNPTQCAESALKVIASLAAPAEAEQLDLDSVIYPPKALLKREDWDALTRKPKVPAETPNDPVPPPTPSTPSQAWEGELPELPMQDKSEWPGTRYYTDHTMQAYARKAIGAAVAGVRNAALEEAAQACGRTGFLYESTPAGCAQAIRSLSSNPVSLTEWPAGQVAKPEYKAEQQARNERARDRLHALAHPASNGNGEKGGDHG